MNEIKKKRHHGIRIQNPPAYDPRSNGAIEGAVDHVMGQTSAIKIGLAGRLKVKVDPKWKIMEWIIEHSCTLSNRGQIGKDGKTP